MSVSQEESSNNPYIQGSGDIEGQQLLTQTQQQQQSQHQTHHQRAPRTPESYFNVPESIALLNIVKSDRIQSAFQSNRKNHASVWEMVAEILSRYNNRKRSAKQCCNRYENLKKIYTQLKRNPEKHVRRNWPYMYLFRQIEEQRGESWGSAAKRRNELSYYHRRRALLLMNNNNNNNNINNTNKDSIAMAAQAVALLKCDTTLTNTNNLIQNNNNILNNKDGKGLFIPNHFIQTEIKDYETQHLNLNNLDRRENKSINGRIIDENERELDLEMDLGNDMRPVRSSSTSSQPLNLDNFDFGGLLHVKDEPPDSDYEEQERNLLYQRINNNYNGQQNIFLNGHHINNNQNDNSNNGEIENDNETNILHPDVIVDTDNITESSTNNSIINIGSKRKNSTSSDEESTNYELIDYLKRREKRDEEMFKRMEEREERLLKLLERTVVAIERIASHNNSSNK